jgi:hypothetical protein
MNNLITTEMVLKFIAVAFVITISMVKSSKSGIMLCSVVILLLLSAGIHITDEGIRGLLPLAAGVGLACVTILPLYLSKRMSSSDFLVTLAAGGIMGISGYMVIIGISCLLILVQWVFRLNGPISVTGSYYSKLEHEAATEMEEHESNISWPRTTGTKNSRADLRDHPCEDTCEDNRTEIKKVMERHAVKINSLSDLAQSEKISQDKRILIMPWRMKISLSTLAVLIIGISI